MGIGQTRPPSTKSAESLDALSLKRLVYPQAASQRFRLGRALPPDDLAHLVDNHWLISWDLRGASPHCQEVLPQPSANMVFEPGGFRLYGLTTRRWSHTLEGTGRIFGTKFRPGAGFLMTGAPAAAWANRGEALEAVYPAARELTAGFDDDDDATRLRRVEAFLRATARRPEGTAHGEATRAYAALEGDPELTTVERLAAAVGLSVRALQRLFRECVGASPKWVIRHLRLHEAAGAIARGTAEPMADMAARLGYFDQAHFTRDFTSVIGESPARYAAACRSAAVQGGAR